MTPVRSRSRRDADPSRGAGLVLGGVLAAAVVTFATWRLDGPPVALAEERPSAAAALGADRWREVGDRLRTDRDPAARLAAAHEILASARAGAADPPLGAALEAMADLDAGAVSRAIEDLAAAETVGPDGQAVLAAAIRDLGRREGLLSADDLRRLFERGARDVRLAAASALASRGDETLLDAFEGVDR